MSGRTQQDDPAWSPGGSSRKPISQEPRSSQRSSRGRKSIPSPTHEELQTMSATEKSKVARRIRNREGAQRSKEQKNLEQQVTQLQRENTRLKAELTTQSAEMDKIKSQFQEYKAQQHNLSPFSSSSYYDVGVDVGAPHLHPTDPMHPQNNKNNHITNPSTPTTNAPEGGMDLPAHPLPPHLASTTTTAPAPVTAAAGAVTGEPDIHSVMQWKYPAAGYYDPSIETNNNMSLQYNHPHHAGLDIEETPLVFTPFAAVTSPRDSLLSPSAAAAAAAAGGGDGSSGGVVGGGHVVGVTEFSAWRPRDNHGGGSGNHFNNNINNGAASNAAPWWWASPTNFGAGEGGNHHYYRENSNSAREMARMMSSPAAFNGSLTLPELR